MYVIIIMIIMMLIIIIISSSSSSSSSSSNVSVRNREPSGAGLGNSCKWHEHMKARCLSAALIKKRQQAVQRFVLNMSTRHFGTFGTKRRSRPSYSQVKLVSFHTQVHMEGGRRRADLLGFRQRERESVFNAIHVQYD